MKAKTCIKIETETLKTFQDFVYYRMEYNRNNIIANC